MPTTYIFHRIIIHNIAPVTDCNPPPPHLYHLGREVAHTVRVCECVSSYLVLVAGKDGVLIKGQGSVIKKSGFPRGPWADRGSREVSCGLDWRLISRQITCSVVARHRSRDARVGSKVVRLSDWPERDKSGDFFSSDLSL